MMLESMKLDEITYGISQRRETVPEKEIQRRRLEGTIELENQENVVSQKPSEEMT